MKIQGKLTTLLCGVSLLAVAIAAGASIYVTREALIERAFAQLTSVRQAKTFEIETYFATVDRHVHSLSESFMVSEAVEELSRAYEELNRGALDVKERNAVLDYYEKAYLPELSRFVDLRSSREAYAPVMPAAVRLQAHYIVNNPHPPGEKAKLEVAKDHGDGGRCGYCMAHRKFHASFRNIVARFGYHDLLLVEVEECLKAEDTNARVVTDFEEYEPSLGLPAAFVCSPIVNPRTGKRFGALVLQLSNREIDRVVSGDKGWARDGLGRSGDSGVVGPDFLMRSNARNFIEHPEAALAGMRKRGESEKRLMRMKAYGTTALLMEVKLPSVEAALEGKSGVLKQRGRSGGMSLVSYAPLNIPGVRWTIGTRMDEAEILAPMNALIRDMMLTVLLVMAVTGLIAWFAGRRFAQPILGLSEAAAQIAAGDLTARAAVKSRDEIGALGANFNTMAESIEAKTRIIEEKNRENEALLLNILPEPIADRLKSGEGSIADHFAEVTVLFADIVGFTLLSSQIPPGEVVEFLNQLFTRFDALAQRLGVEKIKTIGDAYMAVAGIPHPAEDHARRVAELALGIVEETRKYGEERGMDISIRVGLNSGPVVAGVIGTSKFIYDLWGDTVNVASRMESHGEAGQVQVTRPVYEALDGEYSFESRGTIEVKGKGAIETWLLTRRG
ncbi:MAG: HAMP domain-containing protein [Bryobacter sp.]|nr:HAMP domain-containing protein [Bryobacter sp.]